MWDGRASDTSFQAQGPPINPNEMNNTPVGTGNGNQYPPVLIQKMMHRPYSFLFKQIYGKDVFKKYTPLQLYYIWGDAIAAYEATGEVCQFSSKYDASQYGVPAPNPPLYTLTDSEERGRILYGVGPNPNNDLTYGQAQCFQCHTSTGNLPVQLATEGKDTFTMYCFANIGSPKNPNNPYYEMTNPFINPNGYNPLGSNWIDYGLGANPNPSLDGTSFFNTTPGDNQQFNGLFLTPTCRNSDLRPEPGFIKAYFHNGWAKSLHQVVHFYNTRNLTTSPGEVINFLLPNPYANLKGTPLWPMPEVPNPITLTNPTGAPPLPFGATPPPNTNGFGQIGNLGLTPSQEDDLVNFMAILSDGFTAPNPPNAMGSN
jgi:cytochrome c peroxidase